MIRGFGVLGLGFRGPAGFPRQPSAVAGMVDRVSCVGPPKHGGAEARKLCSPGDPKPYEPYKPHKPYTPYMPISPINPISPLNPISPINPINPISL